MKVSGHRGVGNLGGLREVKEYKQNVVCEKYLNIKGNNTFNIDLLVPFSIS